MRPATITLSGEIFRAADRVVHSKFIPYQSYPFLARPSIEFSIEEDGLEYIKSHECDGYFRRGMHREWCNLV
jgi:hypothetical protein